MQAEREVIYPPPSPPPAPTPEPEPEPPAEERRSKTPLEQPKSPVLGTDEENSPNSSENAIGTSEGMSFLRHLGYPFAVINLHGHHTIFFSCCMSSLLFQSHLVDAFNRSSVSYHNAALLALQLLFVVM